MRTLLLIFAGTLAWAQPPTAPSPAPISVPGQATAPAQISVPGQAPTPSAEPGPEISVAPNSGPTEIRINFDVRYVAAGAVYVNGGRDDGLQEGMHLAITRRAPGDALLSATSVAEVVVTAVSAHSAVCDIESSTLTIEVGDNAQISKQDLDSLQVVQQSKTARRYAQVVSFGDGDPFDQEQRDYIPHPPSPEVNRVRAMIAYDFNTINDHIAGLSTVQNGLALRVDITRIHGTYWNFTGYWRGRINTSNAPAQIVTLQDLVNRTYTLGLYYNNPSSPWAMGVGRLYLPWAVSLDVVDGGYVARRFGHVARVGAFFGSSPDPTAWNYKPNREIGGVFTNFEVGRFENVRFTTTVGLALTRLNWKAERQFAFTETSLAYKNFLSFYHNLEADQLVAGRLGNTESGPVISRSFFTARVQPRSWLTLDFNHNYFRTIPTFDLWLVGSGLLDRYLFSGVSGGARVQLPRRIAVYGALGQSSRNDDVRKSLNTMYGVALRNAFNLGFSVDLRRTVFNGAYGSGAYDMALLSRQIGERLRIEVSGGQQDFRSILTADDKGVFVNSNVSWLLGRHYVVGGGINFYRGKIQNYDQTFFSVGYRF